MIVKIEYSNEGCARVTLDNGFVFLASAKTGKRLERIQNEKLPNIFQLEGAQLEVNAKARHTAKMARLRAKQAKQENADKATRIAAYTQLAETETDFAYTYLPSPSGVISLYRKVFPTMADSELAPLWRMLTSNGAQSSAESRGANLASIEHSGAGSVDSGRAQSSGCVLSRKLATAIVARPSALPPTMTTIVCFNDANEVIGGFSSLDGSLAVDWLDAQSVNGYPTWHIATLYQAGNVSRFDSWTYNQ